MRHAELILWDLDGCLIDSTDAITRCIAHALQTVGVRPPAPADLTWCIGPPLLASLERLLREAGRDPGLATRCLDAYRERYVVSSLGETRVIPGIADVLHAVGRRATMAVVTSKPAVAAEPLLEALGLRASFRAVHAPDADHRIELKTVTLARALAHLVPVGAVDAVMIGDRSHDVIAGRACGTATVGLTWGVGDRAELTDAGADVVVDTPEELVALLG